MLRLLGGAGAQGGGVPGAEGGESEALDESTPPGVQLVDQGVEAVTLERFPLEDLVYRYRFDPNGM